MLFQSSISENQGPQNSVHGQKRLSHVKDIVLYNDIKEILFTKVRPHITTTSCCKHRRTSHQSLAHCVLFPSPVSEKQRTPKSYGSPKKKSISYEGFVSSTMRYQQFWQLRYHPAQWKLHIANADRLHSNHLLIVLSSRPQFLRNRVTPIERKPRKTHYMWRIISSTMRYQQYWPWRYDPTQKQLHVANTHYTEIICSFRVSTLNPEFSFQKQRTTQWQPHAFTEITLSFCSLPDSSLWETGDTQIKWKAKKCPLSSEGFVSCYNEICSRGGGRVWLLTCPSCPSEVGRFLG